MEYFLLDLNDMVLIRLGDFDSFCDADEYADKHNLTNSFVWLMGRSAAEGLLESITKTLGGET